MMADSPPAAAVGAELLDTVIDDCRARYSAEPRMSFVQVTSLDSPEHEQRYDAVFCMEVLEHVFDWEPELARISRLLTPGGTLVVSVPVETGVPVLVKQVVRTIAGWRKIGHYPGTTSYSWGELASAVFAGRTQHVKRPVFDFGGGPAHDHKGFNWRVLHERLLQQFDVNRVVASPFSWLGPGLATQVWFICRAFATPIDEAGPCRHRLRPSRRRLAQHGSRRRHAARDAAVGLGRRHRCDATVSANDSAMDAAAGRGRRQPRKARRQADGTTVGLSALASAAPRRIRCLPHRRSQLCASHTGAAGRAHHRDVQRHRRVRSRARSGGFTSRSLTASRRTCARRYIARVARRVHQRSHATRFDRNRPCRSVTHERCVSRRASNLHASARREGRRRHRSAARRSQIRGAACIEHDSAEAHRHSARGVQQGPPHRIQRPGSCASVERWRETSSNSPNVST